ncbi:hypothetical protein BsWGS_00813 [Bradybaena similaris]
MSTNLHLPMAPVYVIATVLFTFLVFLSSGTEACFIRNCPKGGKRSMDSSMEPRRECRKCGLGDVGQCVGPHICCGPQFGCHIGTPETEVCQQENDSLSPCFVKGDVCGARDSGNCVANGICCDGDSCAVNERCRQTRATAADMTKKTSRNDILKLIEELLEDRNYD